MSLRASDELTLVASTLAHLEAELNAPDAFPALLESSVPADLPTVAVLRRCGFAAVGAGEQPGTFRFERGPDPHR